MNVQLKNMADRIRSELCAQLNEFRGFRHVLRNVYTFKFDPNKIEKLVDQAPAMFFSVRQELLAFADILEDSA